MPVATLSYKLLLEQQASYPPYPETPNADHCHYKCPHCLKVVSVAESVAKHKCLYCFKPVLVRDLFGNLLLSKSEPPFFDRIISDKVSSKPAPPIIKRKISSSSTSTSSSSSSASTRAHPSSSSSSSSSTFAPLATRTRHKKNSTYDYSSESEESSGQDSDSESEGDVPLLDLAYPREEPAAPSQEATPSDRRLRPLPFPVATPSLSSEHFFKNPSDSIKVDGSDQAKLLQQSSTQLTNYTAFIPLLEKTFKSLGNNVPHYVRANTFTRVQLRPYQVAGVCWLIRNFDKGLFSIIDDPPGIGRGVQISCFLTYLRAVRNIAGPHLILTTSAATAERWVDRLARYCPLHSFVNLAGPNADPEAVETRLGSINIFIATPPALNDLPKLFSVPFLVRALCFGPNDPLSCFGDSLDKMQQTHMTPFTCVVTHQEGDQNSSHSPFEAVTYPNLISTFAHKPFADVLLSKLQRDGQEVLVLNRTREQIQSELPEVKETPLFTPASELQAERYNQILRRKGPSNYTELLQLAEQLVRVCCHPSLAYGFPPHTSDWQTLMKESGKFYCFHRLVKGMQYATRQAVVFSQFPAMLAMFETYAREEDIAYVRIDKNTSASQVAALNSCAPTTPPALYIISSLYEGPGLDLSSVYGTLIYDQVPISLRALLQRFHIGEVRLAHVYHMVGASSAEQFLLQARSGSPSALPWTAAELWGAIRFGADVWLQNKAATDVTLQGVDSLLKVNVLPEEDYDFPLAWDTKTQESLMWEPVSEIASAKEIFEKDLTDVERIQMYSEKATDHQSSCLFCGKPEPSLQCLYCTHAAHPACVQAKEAGWECSAHACAVCGMRQQKTGRILMMCVECKQAWCEDHFPARSLMEVAQPDVRLHLVTCFQCKIGPAELAATAAATTPTFLPTPSPEPEFEEISELPEPASGEEVCPEAFEMVRATLRGSGLEGSQLDRALSSATSTLEKLQSRGLMGTALFTAWKSSSSSSTTPTSSSSSQPRRRRRSSASSISSSSSSFSSSSSSSSSRASRCTSSCAFSTSLYPANESESEADMDGIIRSADAIKAPKHSDSEAAADPGSPLTYKKRPRLVSAESKESSSVFKSEYIADPWAIPGEEEDSDDNRDKEGEEEETSAQRQEKEARRKKREEMERRRKEEEQRKQLYEEKFSEVGETLEDGQKAWEAEQILKERKGRKGTEYLVKWLGFSEEHNTWEPRSSLRSCELLDKWEENHPLKKKRKKRH